MTYVEHVHCSRCGKRCSGVDPELGLVVRAWVECPDCLEHPQAEAWLGLTVADINQINRRLSAGLEYGSGSGDLEARKAVGELQWKLVALGQQIEQRVRAAAAVREKGSS